MFVVKRKLYVLMGSNFKAISYRFVQKLTLIQRGYAVLELKNNQSAAIFCRGKPWALDIKQYTHH